VKNDVTGIGATIFRRSLHHGASDSQCKVRRACEAPSLRGLCTSIGGKGPDLTAVYRIQWSLRT
jgi:hypothetical protein